jgi:hypothetical protein
MREELGGDHILYEIKTPLGFNVRVSQTLWDKIVTLKHPVMKGREEEVKKTLSAPDEIRLSKVDTSVYLFYRAQDSRRWVCAVSKRLNDKEGF